MDISFALRRGTIAQVTTALDAAQRAAEAELAVNEVGLAWKKPVRSPLLLRRHHRIHPAMFVLSYV
jgi:hypothetical protein